VETEVENTATHCGTFADVIHPCSAVPTADISTSKHTDKETYKYTYKDTCKHTYKETSAAADAPCASPAHERGAAAAGGEAEDDEV
jgi:hypothetical protein